LRRTIADLLARMSALGPFRPQRGQARGSLGRKPEAPRR
jgi:hypothetical protein